MAVVVVGEWVWDEAGAAGGVKLVSYETRSWPNYRHNQTMATPPSGSECEEGGEVWNNDYSWLAKATRQKIERGAGKDTMTSHILIPIMHVLVSWRWGHFRGQM